MTFERVVPRAAAIFVAGVASAVAQDTGIASGKIGDVAFEGAVSCEFGDKIEVVTPDGGRADNDGDGFAMRLRGEPSKGFQFNIVLGDKTYTGGALGGLNDKKLLIAAPELSYLDGNGVVPTFIEVVCGE